MPAQILKARRRILVVEDEPGIADTICYALSTDGFDPHVCALGGEALAALETGEFALAILDVGLPDVNGFELFRQIRVRAAQDPDFASGPRVFARRASRTRVG